MLTPPYPPPEMPTASQPHDELSEVRSRAMLSTSTRNGDWTEISGRSSRDSLSNR